MGRSQRDISTLIAARVGTADSSTETGLRLTGIPHNALPGTEGDRREDLVGLTRSIGQSTGRAEYSRKVTASLVALENMNAVDTAVTEADFLECLARLTPSQVLCGSLGQSWRNHADSWPNGAATLEME